MMISLASNDISSKSDPRFSVNFDLAGSLIESSEGDALWPLLVSLGGLLSSSADDLINNQ